jgi:hypothetical protein
MQTNVPLEYLVHLLRHTLSITKVQGGRLDVPIDGGQSITIEFRGELRPFRGGQLLPDDQIPEDPNVVAAAFTVVAVEVRDEMVAHAGWNDHGWFGDIKRGSWEADLIWALT